jgi:molybdenum cofactor biosynthesis enzyme MoaA
MSPKGIKRFCHSDILSYGKILFIFKTATRIGFNMVLPTGGEPLVRGNVSDLAQQLTDILKIIDLSTTTNGSESTSLLVY